MNKDEINAIIKKRNIDFQENFMSELVLDDENIEVIDIEGNSMDTFLSLSNENSSQYDIFISYSHYDINLAQELYEYLSSKNLKVFFSSKSLEGGDNLNDTINKALKQSKVLIAVGTNKAHLNSVWCTKERTSFLVQKSMDSSKRLYSYIDLPMTVADLPNDLKMRESFSKRDLNRLYVFVSEPMKYEGIESNGET